MQPLMETEPLAVMPSVALGVLPKNDTTGTQFSTPPLTLPVIVRLPIVIAPDVLTVAAKGSKQKLPLKVAGPKAWLGTCTITAPLPQIELDSTLTRISVGSQVIRELKDILTKVVPARMVSQPE